MDRLIYTAMTGAKHTLGQQGAVSHNLANVDSTGFRTEMHKLRAVEVQTGTHRTRAFVVDASVANDFTPGPLKQTGRAFDAAIEGKGWFAVQMPDGSEAYTRDGSFDVSPNGVLQTRSGLPIVSADGGPIAIPPNAEITIGRDGSISAVEAGGVVNVVAQLKRVNPPEPELVRGDDGYFRLGDGEIAPIDENVLVAGGFVEGSNVNVVDQMVTMISLARQFEMQTRMIQTAETNDQAASRILGNR